MTWHEGTVQNKREALTLIGALATSQYVATLQINAAGTGYVVGEIITIGHAGAFVPATAEVLTVGGGGAVTSLRLRNWGAYADRVATVAINAAGTGYVVGDILEIQGGTGRAMGKARVDTVGGGGAITGVSVFETGGAYATTPGATGAATLGIGPSTFAGDNAATLDLTFTGLIGTTGLATTASASGTGLTVDITLAQTGWFTGSFNNMRDTNDFSLNGVNDELQLALRGTVTGGDEPFCMQRTGTQTVGLDDNHYIGWCTSDSFNPGIDFNAQVGRTSDIDMVGSGRYTPFFDAQTQEVWISISQRSIRIAVKTQGQTVLSYQWGYNGLYNPFATAIENPYPSGSGGSTSIATYFPDDTTPGRVTGPIEAYEAAGAASPWTYRRQEDGSIGSARNADPFGSVQRTRGIYPCMENNNITDIFDASTISGDGRRQWYDIIRPDGAAATIVMLPTPDSGGALFVPVPAVILETTSTSEPVSSLDKLRAEIENMFWVTGLDGTGAAINAEDTVTDQNGLRYRVLRSGSRTEPYSLWCMAEQ